MIIETPLVSVIIPVYNVEAYLEECLESVMAQTYSSLEVVLVDDGSTDDSPAICDSYASRDPRVVAIHQVNAGAASARNAGVGASWGPLVTFLDSDDQWERTFVERLVAALDGHPQAGIAMSSFRRVPGPPHSPPAPEVRLLAPHESVEFFVGPHHTLFAISCAKVYRRELLAQPPFPVGRLDEDEFMTYRALLQASTVLVPEPLYLYRLRGAGSSSSVVTPERQLDALDAVELQGRDFHAAGYLDAAGWARDHAFRKRVRLIRLLKTAGRDGEAARQSAVLSRVAREHPPLPRSTVFRALERVARHHPGLAVSVFAAATAARPIVRRVARRESPL